MGAVLVALLLASTPDAGVEERGVVYDVRPPDFAEIHSADGGVVTLTPAVCLDEPASVRVGKVVAAAAVPTKADTGLVLGVAGGSLALGIAIGVITVLLVR